MKLLKRLLRQKHLPENKLTNIISYFSPEIVGRMQDKLDSSEHGFVVADFEISRAPLSIDPVDIRENWIGLMLPIRKGLLTSPTSMRRRVHPIDALATMLADEHRNQQKTINHLLINTVGAHAILEFNLNDGKFTQRIQLTAS